VKNTNIAHRRVWDHRNTASWDFIHRITALKKHQHHNTANFHVPLHVITHGMHAFRYKLYTYQFVIDKQSW